MKRLIAILLAASTLTLLAACASPLAQQADRFHVLDAAASKAAAPVASRRATTLLLAPTTAAAFYDTQDIVFSKSPGTRALYQFSHWTEAPGQRVGSLLAARLARAGIFRSVAAANSGVRGRWLLRTNVDEIYHDASSTPGSVRLVLTAELSDPGKRDLVARRSFSATLPAGGFDADGAVQSMRLALAQVFDELTAWVDATAVE